MFSKFEDIPSDIASFYVVDDEGVVSLIDKKETKSMSDVYRIVAVHKGKRDDLIFKFLEMVNEGLKWEYHDSYIEFMNTPVDMSLQEDGESTDKPVMPVLTLIDIDAWFLDNYKLLRESAYPDYNRQMEMQFDDIMNGTSLWVDTINKVKAQYPKGAL